MKYIPTLSGFSAGFCFCCGLDASIGGLLYHSLIFMAFAAANIFMAIMAIMVIKKQSKVR